MWRWHPLLETLDPRFCSCTHSHQFHGHSAKKLLTLLEVHTELSPLLTILTAPWQLVPISILEQNLAQFFTKIVLNPHVDEKPPHGFVLDIHSLTYSQVEYGISDPTIGGSSWEPSLSRNSCKVSLWAALWMWSGKHARTWTRCCAQGDAQLFPKVTVAGREWRPWVLCTSWETLTADYSSNLV